MTSEEVNIYLGKKFLIKFRVNKKKSGNWKCLNGRCGIFKSACELIVC